MGGACGRGLCSPQPCTHDTDVAKLVGRGHGVVVEETGRGHPAGVGVIGKDDELVLVAAVANPEQALLDVSHDHTLPTGVDAGHQVGDVLVEDREQQRQQSP